MPEAGEDTVYQRTQVASGINVEIFNLQSTKPAVYKGIIKV